MIDHDRKLKEFMGRKDQERTEAHEQMEAMKKKKGQSHKSSPISLHYYRLRVQIHVLVSSIMLFYWQYLAYTCTCKYMYSSSSYSPFQ